MKRGFTIVELLMVVAIIAVLLGIVTTAASSSIKMSRTRKAQALCHMVESGLAAYYAQKDEWPNKVDKSLARDNEKPAVSLNADQVRGCVLALVKETKEGNPMMDISGLFVSRNPGTPQDNGKCHHCGQNKYKPDKYYGMDFMSAIRGTKKSQNKMKTAEMYFGYPHSSNGRFMPFYMSYNFATDQINVGTWHDGSH